MREQIQQVEENMLNEIINYGCNVWYSFAFNESHMNSEYFENDD